MENTDRKYILHNYPKNKEVKTIYSLYFRLNKLD